MLPRDLLTIGGVGGMAIRMGVAPVAVAVSLATLVHIPVSAVARSGGSGFGVRHSFIGSPRMQRNRAFNAVPYGGFVAATLSNVSTSESDIPPPQGREFTPDSPRVVTCQRSQETMTVPAEGGGEQQIRITRC